jgi:predicted kinase
MSESEYVFFLERYADQTLPFLHTDEIRRMLPEYSTYVENSPDLLDALTQKECGYIAETLVYAALQAGRNVIFDGCLRQAEWYVQYIRGLRDTYPHLSVGMIHVTADMNLILDRAHAHAEDTGRKLDEGIHELALQHIPKSIEMVKPEVDHFFVIRNNDRLELEGGDWDTFTSTFVQTCALTPGRKPRREVSEEEKKESTFSALHRPGRHRRISLFISSADNHGTSEMKFYGRFAHIRKTLDYSYHTNYRRDRQIFQDAIISDFLDAAVVKDKNGELCTTPTEPWIVFTAGAMGAGKGYTKKRLVAKGVFPLMAFVNVDPDEVRRRLPEFYLYVNEVPEQAGALTRMEAGFIVEILTLAALQAGKNVLVDGSLRDSDWYKSYFIRLRKEFSVLRIAIIHVTAPREAVFQRAAVSYPQTFSSRHPMIAPISLILVAGPSNIFW